MGRRLRIVINMIHRTLLVSLLDLVSEPLAFPIPSWATTCKNELRFCVDLHGIGSSVSLLEGRAYAFGPGPATTPSGGQASSERCANATNGICKIPKTVSASFVQQLHVECPRDPNGALPFVLSPFGLSGPYAATLRAPKRCERQSDAGHPLQQILRCPNKPPTFDVPPLAVEFTLRTQRLLQHCATSILASALAFDETSLFNPSLFLMRLGFLHDAEDHSDFASSFFSSSPTSLLSVAMHSIRQRNRTGEVLGLSIAEALRVLSLAPLTMDVYTVDAVLLSPGKTRLRTALELVAAMLSVSDTSSTSQTPLTSWMLSAHVAPTLFVILVNIATVTVQSTRHLALQCLEVLARRAEAIPSVALTHKILPPVVHVMHSLSLKGATKSPTVQLGVAFIASLAARWMANGVPRQLLPAYGSSLPFPLILLCRSLLESLRHTRPLPPAILLLASEPTTSVSFHHIPGLCLNNPQVKGSWSIGRAAARSEKSLVATFGKETASNETVMQFILPPNRRGNVVMGWALKSDADTHVLYRVADALAVIPPVVTEDGQQASLQQSQPTLPPIEPHVLEACCLGNTCMMITPTNHVWMWCNDRFQPATSEPINVPSGSTIYVDMKDDGKRLRFALYTEIPNNSNTAQTATSQNGSAAAASAAAAASTKRTLSPILSSRDELRFSPDYRMLAQPSIDLDRTEAFVTPMYFCEYASEAIVKVYRRKEDKEYAGARLQAALTLSLEGHSVPMMRSASAHGMVSDVSLDALPARSLDFYIQLAEFLETLDTATSARVESIVSMMENLKGCYPNVLHGRDLRIPAHEVAGFSFVESVCEEGKRSTTSPSTYAVPSTASLNNNNNNNHTTHGGNNNSNTIALAPLFPYIVILKALESLCVVVANMISNWQQVPEIGKLWSDLKPLCRKSSRLAIQKEALGVYCNRPGVRVGVTIHTVRALPSARKPEVATLQSSVFAQMHSQLINASVKLFYQSPMVLVRLAGFGAQDAGGPYREALTLLGAEIMATHPSGQYQMNPLFTKGSVWRRRAAQATSDHAAGGETGAHDEDQGDSDLLMPLPNGHPLINSQTTYMYEFFGKLLAFFLTTSDVLAIDLAPWFWKQLLGQEATLRDVLTTEPDLARVLRPEVLHSERALCDLEPRHPGITAAWNAWKQAQAAQLPSRTTAAQRSGFSRTGSLVSPVAQTPPFSLSSIGLDALNPDPSNDGMPSSLQPSLFVDEEALYHNMSQCLIDLELHRYDTTMSIIRRGFNTIVPLTVLETLFWADVMQAICGDPCVTADALRGQMDISHLSKSAQAMFMSVLEGMQPVDRSLLLRFATGQSRLPLKRPIKVTPQPGETNGFPRSATCFYNLSLPSYTSERSMRERVLYAIRHCHAIDADGAAADGMGIAE